MHFYLHQLFQFKYTRAVAVGQKTSRRKVHQTKMWLATCIFEKVLYHPQETNYTQIAIKTVTCYGLNKHKRLVGGLGEDMGCCCICCYASSENQKVMQDFQKYIMSVMRFFHSSLRCLKWWQATGVGGKIPYLHMIFCITGMILRVHLHVCIEYKLIFHCIKN